MAVAPSVSAHAFITTYDPLGGRGGSIDPLGALRTYGELAELLLPGLTTITTRSRYLSMLCAALRNGERHRRFAVGPAGVAERRRAAEPFERLWALACVAARERGRPLAAAGLRGVTYAEKALREFQERQGPATPEFRLLKSQARTGGVPTYWTILRSGGLVNEDGSLTTEGKALAEQFPEPPGVDLARLADPTAARRATAALEDIDHWGVRCHLAAADAREKSLLIDALQSAERRDRVARALDRYLAREPMPDAWQISHLWRLRDQLARDEGGGKPALSTVVEVVIVVEQFHEAALRAFEILLWWGTRAEEQPVSQLVGDQGFRETVDQAHRRAEALVRLTSGSDDPELRRILEDFASLAREVMTLEPRAFLEAIVRRHQRVQAGKVDGGVPKKEWVVVSASGVRTLPRYQRTERPSVPRGRYLTHPYRLEQFVGMLRENGGLSSTIAGSSGPRG